MLFIMLLALFADLRDTSRDVSGCCQKLLDGMEEWQAGKHANDRDRLKMMDKIFVDSHGEYYTMVIEENIKHRRTT